MFWILEEINLKNKKTIRFIAILISIIILILDIIIYINMKTTWKEIGTNHHQYENFDLIISGLFTYATLIWGLLSILIIWIEYFLINLLAKIFNSFNGLKKLLFCLIMIVVIALLLIIFIKIMLLMVSTLS